MTGKGRKNGIRNLAYPQGWQLLALEVQYASPCLHHPHAGKRVASPSPSGKIRDHN
jgi:hypothetical protein